MMCLQRLLSWQMQHLMCPSAFFFLLQTMLGFLNKLMCKLIIFLQKQLEWQDVETVEDSKVCAISQNICYGTMVITAVILTLTDDKNVEMLEVRVTKGCGTLSDFMNGTDREVIGKYNANRRCWTSSLSNENIDLSDLG
jgi:hypothetical protein